eukprot:SAG22_NODE_8430_length_657_cov_0.897849_1_plen_157_part_10
MGTKEKPPTKPSNYELLEKKQDRGSKVEVARAFDDAVFEQIKMAEAETGQKLRPGSYFKILDKDKDGVLTRGESAAVDELFGTSGPPARDCHPSMLRCHPSTRCLPCCCCHSVCACRCRHDGGRADRDHRCNQREDYLRAVQGRRAGRLQALRKGAE